MQKEIIGYGSFIEGTYGRKLPQVSTPNFGETILFYAGRYALKYLIKRIQAATPIGTIWMPQYYCPFVKEWMNHEFESIKYYYVDPFDPESKIDWTQFKSTKDLVMVNNYWGLKNTDIPEGDRPIIIEDHSHGWLSEGSLNSKADFCFASLRKTLPIPMGGIAWKPKASKSDISLNNSDIFDSYSGENPMNEAWDTIIGSMELKATCTKNGQKERYLEQYMNGELMVRSIYEVYKVSAAHAAFINQYIHTDFNSFKKKNVDYTYPKLKKSDTFKIVRHETKAPFGLLLAFKSLDTLNELKKHLVTNQIYPALLWPTNDLTTEYTYLLNIHMDYRFDTTDLNYIITTINNWITSNK
ncbi:hypothetical protein SAMN04488007_3321 [Maribacter aquivivus]|uniref:dTDP-4-amino-4,6-dideoxygalactose transaminase n=1 Tax=Maribacter aquivivus TaxID=228958 RepID=A0A1M6TQK8_9FLAO|nr:hypothetical protein [Maribacter aquivivus]SHK59224.1 hypothetical protein SAMN04488007_3321 [Maribacter aquivivus]